MDRVQLILLAAALSGASCQGTAGNRLVTFHAAAAGPTDAVRPLAFTNDAGYDVQLSTAILHIGAVYLNQTLPVSGAQATSCVLPGVYVGQVVEGLDVDLLSADPQPFPALGEGTDLAAQAGEVWLTHGDVDADDDTLPILQIDGTATKGGAAYPFTGTLTIGANRRIPPPDSSQPGANPICKQRIVSGIVVDLTLADGGALTVRADPRALLASIDFSELAPTSATPPTFVFDDSSQTHASLLLYKALHFAGTVYRFEWADPGLH
jgi:hypothetical protein